AKPPKLTSDFSQSEQYFAPWRSGAWSNDVHGGGGGGVGGPSVVVGLFRLIDVTSDFLSSTSAPILVAHMPLF
ncbi:unnamed protein product, partial [Musa banksii]